MMSLNFQSLLLVHLATAMAFFSPVLGEEGNDICELMKGIDVQNRVLVSLSR